MGMRWRTATALAGCADCYVVDECDAPAVESVMIAQGAR
jgi:hypothetical protein